MTAPPPSSFATCTLCDWLALEPTRPVAEAAAVWHIYENHPGEWQSIIGSDRRPRHPDPRTAEGLQLLRAEES